MLPDRMVPSTTYDAFALSVVRPHVTSSSPACQASESERQQYQAHDSRE